MRRGLVLFLVFVTSVLKAAPSERPEDIARIHVAAIGGRKQVEALSALRITGHAVTPSQRVQFTLTAARPNRVRMETRMGDRLVVQGSDGLTAPWERDESKPPARAVRMAPAAAERFLADADFDDPLVCWQERGYRLEPAGSIEIKGKRLLRVLVVRDLTRNVFLCIDPTTYFIVLRLQEFVEGGRRTEIATHYADFRSVAGVLLPHEITLLVDGQLSQRAKFDVVEANPKIEPDIFTPGRP
jgi:hypothetical protein